MTAESRNKTQEKAAMAAICKNLAEMSGCEMKPVHKDWCMERGTRLEPEARGAYEYETGKETEEVGFCIHENGGFGCSPDAFIDGRKGMVQIKCPLPQTHVKYLLNQDTFLADYKIQMHMEMAVTGASFNDFYSYCPGLPSMLVRVDRDAFTEDLLRGLIRLSSEFEEYKEEMARKWGEMSARLES